MADVGYTQTHTLVQRHHIVKKTCRKLILPVSKQINKLKLTIYTCNSLTEQLQQNNLSSFHFHSSKATTASQIHSQSHSFPDCLANMVLSFKFHHTEQLFKLYPYEFYFCFCLQDCFNSAYLHLVCALSFHTSRCLHNTNTVFP